MSFGDDTLHPVSKEELLFAILLEIEHGNKKHGHAPLAPPTEVVSILSEEVGEFAGEINKGNMELAKKELVQVAAVAINYLLGTGPHSSKL